jgi:hypothetical protein
LFLFLLLLYSRCLLFLCWWGETVVDGGEVILLLILLLLWHSYYSEHTMPQGWNTTTATNMSITGRCAERNCSATEVCVPTLSTSGAKDRGCFNYAAVCGNITISGGDLLFNGTMQEQNATLTCRPGRHMLPTGASGQLICDVRGRWLPENSSCDLVGIKSFSISFITILLILKCSKFSFCQNRLFRIYPCSHYLSFNTETLRMP